MSPVPEAMLVALIIGVIFVPVAAETNSSQTIAETASLKSNASQIQLEKQPGEKYEWASIVTEPSGDALETSSPVGLSNDSLASTELAPEPSAKPNRTMGPWQVVSSSPGPETSAENNETDPTTTGFALSPNERQGAAEEMESMRLCFRELKEWLGSNRIVKLNREKLRIELVRCRDMGLREFREYLQHVLKLWETGPKGGPEEPSWKGKFSVGVPGSIPTLKERQDSEELERMVLQLGHKSHEIGAQLSKFGLRLLQLWQNGAEYRLRNARTRDDCEMNVCWQNIVPVGTFCWPCFGGKCPLKEPTVYPNRRRCQAQAPPAQPSPKWQRKDGHGRCVTCTEELGCDALLPEFTSQEDCDGSDKMKLDLKKGWTSV